MTAGSDATAMARERGRVSRFLALVAVFAAVFGVAYMASGLLLGRGLLLLSAGVDVAFLGVVFGASRMIRRGRVTRAVLLISYGLMLTALVSAPLAPFLFPSLLLVPLMAVATALPHVTGRALWVLCIVGFVVACAIAAVGTVTFAWVLGPFWIRGGLLLATLIAGVFLTFLQLHHFSRRIRETLNGVRSSEERFRCLALASSQIVWVTDAEGSVREDSPSWRNFTGQALEAFKGWGWLDAIHPDDRDAARRGWSRAVSAREPYQTQYRLERATGGYAHVMVRAAPVTHEFLSGVREWVVMNIDITEQKAAEEALREANQRKDQFLAVLGHELRNPLAPILSAVEILRTPGQGGDPERKLEIIDRQVRHVARLVDDLLDVSRITHGKVDLRREDVDLAAIVARVAETVRTLVDRRRHELSVALPDAPLVVHGDPVRLEQIALNLVSNAVRYTPPGGHIWLEAAPAGGKALLRVRDDGVGISPEMLPRMFHPFVQGRQGAEMAHSGLGIGLSLVKGFVELQGGSVSVQSAGLGRGSEFVVQLPQVVARAAPTVSLPAHVPPTAAARVLVVDDNEDAAEMLAELVSSEGHMVRTAADGVTALRIASELRPNVVLLDIGLPQMDGYEVARRMRQMPELVGATLVAVTGYGQEADRRRALEAGFERHIVKPVSWEALRSLLQSVAPHAPAVVH